MNFEESAITFACRGEMLTGILSQPEQASDTTVIVVVGGPQYRVGSHRQFLQLARHLARQGYPVLRFDGRGMGDSSGLLRSFEEIDDDIGAAIGTITARRSNSKIVLWGLCDGASAALMYWHTTRDPRVSGLVLCNPWARSEISLARAQVKHYYTRRLMQREFWSKLLRGGIGASALTGLALRATSAMRRVTLETHNAGPMSRQPFQQRMADACLQFPGKILLMLSGQDLTAKEFVEQVKASPVWRSAINSKKVTRADLHQANHTFSDPRDSAEVEALTLHWLDAMTKKSHRIQAKIHEISTY